MTNDERADAVISRRALGCLVARLQSAFEIVDCILADPLGQQKLVEGCESEVAGGSQFGAERIDHHGAGCGGLAWQLVVQSAGDVPGPILELECIQTIRCILPKGPRVEIGVDLRKRFRDECNMPGIDQLL